MESNNIHVDLQHLCTTISQTVCQTLLAFYQNKPIAPIPERGQSIKKPDNKT
jgi:hypothetical protein